MKHSLIYSFFIQSILVMNCLAQENNQLDYLQKLDQLKTQKIDIEKKIQTLHKIKQEYKANFSPSDSIYAKMLHRLGIFQFETGKIDSAIYYTEKGIHINEKHKKNTDPSYLTNSYYNLGYYYMQLSIPEQSIIYFDSCRQIGSKYDNKIDIVLMAYERLIREYSTLGNYYKAVNLAKIGIDLSNRLNNERKTIYKNRISNQLYSGHIAFREI